MGNRSHVERLRSGVIDWNDWRRTNRGVLPDLAGADLRGLNLERVNLKHATLCGANFRSANLAHAKLQFADLRRAILNDADLSRAVLSNAKLNNAKLYGTTLNRTDLTEAVLNGATLYEVTLSHVKLKSAKLVRAKLISSLLPGTELMLADLRNADLSDTRFIHADLSGADLTGANLIRASIIDSNLENAVLDRCLVYGTSAWNIRLDKATQRNLVITPKHESSAISVDNLEVAQFVYLLLNNVKIRSVIDTITSKLVLILGRFTSERIAVLEAIQQELRKLDFLPVLFNFEKPAHRSVSETVSTLAHMARFVIADITDAKSIPQELMKIVPSLPTVPVQPLLVASQRPYGMFDDFRLYPWVLEPFLYQDQEALLLQLTERVIAPAEAKAQELIGRMRKLT